VVSEYSTNRKSSSPGGSSWAKCKLPSTLQMHPPHIRVDVPMHVALIVGGYNADVPGTHVVIRHSLPPPPKQSFSASTMSELGNGQAQARRAPALTMGM